ncbi:hypothetical protein LJC64_05175 [Ruminococcaceae bacterium OttesenSCG-928-A11]|nr:hypothetical protein [Ruminococcaceae bacterium OttesenSCG-928-A11]
MNKLSVFNFGLDEYVSIMTALHCMNGSFADMVEDLTEFGPEEWVCYRERMDNILWEVYENFPCAGDPCKNPPPTHAQRLRAQYNDMDIYDELCSVWDTDDLAEFRIDDDRDVYWPK